MKEDISPILLETYRTGEVSRLKYCYIAEVEKVLAVSRAAARPFRFISNVFGGRSQKWNCKSNLVSCQGSFGSSQGDWPKREECQSDLSSLLFIAKLIPFGIPFVVQHPGAPGTPNPKP